MGLFGKERVSEAEAAAVFVGSILLSVQKNWPQITSQFTPFLRRVPEHLNSEWSQYEFALASIALQIQALPNLLPPDQAERVRSFVFACLAAPELGSEPLEVIELYENAWKAAIAAAEPPCLAPVLYERLQLRDYTAPVTLGKAQFVSPLLLAAMEGAITYHGGPWWKSYLAEHKLAA